ncbi:MAG: hypothetical protein BJ554DRAFT_2155 [Olpidium bornovanus]|uniref:Protein kinase domain-containing protein n=1 Tax=Olpidium bornovanus TaxID=278681 RepID=A0A8H7ZQF5_9FUNG|nr:MAG: hypothetical protein BJ554DRAFT_2155 [Olpidium bornovanus]
MSPPDSLSSAAHSPTASPPLSPACKSSAAEEECAKGLRRTQSEPLVAGQAPGSSGRKSRGPPSPTRSPARGGLTSGGNQSGLLTPPEIDLSPKPSPRASPSAIRRTYSSSSIKIRAAEVGPSDFVKIKLLGRGDVGRVYLVKKKASEKLYAMKGVSFGWQGTSEIAMDGHVCAPGRRLDDVCGLCSSFKEGDDQAQQNPAGARRAGDIGDFEPPVYSESLPLLSIGGLPVSLHGVLRRGRVLQRGAPVFRSPVPLRSASQPAINRAFLSMPPRPQLCRAGPESLFRNSTPAFTLAR